MVAQAPFEAVFSTDNADFSGLDDDAVDHRAEPCLAPFDGAGRQALDERAAEGFYNVRIQLGLLDETGPSPFEGRTRQVAFSTKTGNPALKRRLGRIEDAVLNRCIEILQRLFCIGSFTMKLTDPLFDRPLPRSLASMQGLQNACQTIRGRQPLDERCHDTRFGRFPANRLVRAGDGALVDGFGAAIIIVDLAMASRAAARRHRHLAATAPDQTAKERRRAVEAGTALGGLSLAELFLDRVEGFGSDDLRNAIVDDVAIGVLVAMFVEHVPGSGAGIGVPNQHLVDCAGIKFGAPAREISGCVEMLDDRTHAHRARRSVAIQREMENQADDFGLDGVDLQLSLDSAADGVGFDRAITEWCRSAVRVAKFGGGDHPTQRADLGVMRLEFVGEAQRQSHDLAAIASFEVLSHRADGDLVPAEDANRLFLIEQVTEPARDRVNEDCVDALGSVLAARQHLLQFWTL